MHRSSCSPFSDREHTTTNVQLCPRDAGNRPPGSYLLTAAAGLRGLAGCSGSGGGTDSITIATAPNPTTKLQAGSLREQTNIFQGGYEELSSEAELQLSWDERSPFMGGQANLAPSVGSIEAGKHADTVLDQADAGRLVLTAGDFRVRVR